MKFLYDNWLVIAGFLTPIVTFLTGWKLRKINYKKEGATALDSIQKVYDTFTTQTDSKFTELFKEIADLKTENVEQRKAIRDLQKDNRDLHLEVSKLMKKNNELMLENQALKMQNKTSSDGSK